MELLTAAQMRAIEQAAINSGEVTGLELMERAGVGVVEAIFEWRPELAEGERRAVILCGPGNNGGDGFVVARLLKQHGWAIEAFLYGDEEKLPPDAAENCRRWRELGDIKPLENFFFARGPIEDLCIDALFGTGLSRPLEGDTARAVSLMASCYAFRCVAVDAPSGVCMDSGRILSELAASHYHTDPELIVTFHTPKRGHYLDIGPYLSGKLVVVDIGLESESDRYERLSETLPSDQFKEWSESRLEVIEDDELRVDGVHWLDKHPGIHKYSHGHALIISGGMAKTGAARLAARGALRIGAGLVTVASPPSALMENAAHLTAIMLQKMKGPEGLADILSDPRINAVVIGPGCGIGEETRALVATALERPAPSPRGGEGRGEGERTVILDADALTSYAGDPEILFTSIKASPCSIILTPHGGEFARLFPDLAAKLAEPPTKGPAYSIVDATREAAARSGATVLYKGADTVIAEPDGHCSIAAAVYDRAAPWLATAGSGDVLAGMIAGLAARSVYNPAASAAWLHQECGRHLGPGLIAEDIPEAIPSVLKRVLEWKAP